MNPEDTEELENTTTEATEPAEVVILEDPFTVFDNANSLGALSSIVLLAFSCLISL